MNGSNNEPEEWNEEKRTELRSNLSMAILGQLRMAKLGHGDIVEYCNDVYLEDGCPEAEIASFTKFVQDNLAEHAKLLAIEQASWPSVTDCDRMDKVEANLRHQGILFWQASVCCDSCTMGEMPDRLNLIDDRFPGFYDRARGYAFFIDQTIPESLASSTNLSVYLGYGWLNPDDEKTDEDIYRQHALAIAHEVCNALRAEGFEVDWNGDFARKIGVTLNWQRRTLLE
jgi:hypothetical protein